MVGTLNEMTITINQVETDGYKVGGYVFVSNCYLEDDDNIGLATEILDQLGQAIGYALDKAILFGTGTKMPVGIATRLAAAASPAWWGTNQGTFTNLSTSNVKKLKHRRQKRCGVLRRSHRRAGCRRYQVFGRKARLGVQPQDAH